ncbi:hypothetical protein P7K49_021688 [Saguinus oedipus]|uniref:Uncharacterized protein n=1 Tax=Saguinus oedipus TaxID=9490 RepID=A0ABQ9UTD2_SAGOE|nr:hypothetical protein P7K49_021688 [Saguinus oedipus]
MDGIAGTLEGESRQQSCFFAFHVASCSDCGSRACNTQQLRRAECSAMTVIPAEVAQFRQQPPLHLLSWNLSNTAYPFLFQLQVLNMVEVDPLCNPVLKDRVRTVSESREMSVNLEKKVLPGAGAELMMIALILITAKGQHDQQETQTASVSQLRATVAFDSITQDDKGVPELALPLPPSMGVSLVRLMA